MNCWLIITRDCTRPCDCSSQHPLTLTSNPGIQEGDKIVITDGEYRIPCCLAVVKSVIMKDRTYVYLTDCSEPNEDFMNYVIKFMRSTNLLEAVINITQHTTCK